MKFRKRQPVSAADLQRISDLDAVTLKMAPKPSGNPVWLLWNNLPSVTLLQATLLAFSLSPASITRTQVWLHYGHPGEPAADQGLRADLQRVLTLAHAHARKGTLALAEEPLAGAESVELQEFARWAATLTPPLALPRQFPTPRTAGPLAPAGGVRASAAGRKATAKSPGAAAGLNDARWQAARADRETALAMARQLQAPHNASLRAAADRVCEYLPKSDKPSATYTSDTIKKWLREGGWKPARPDKQ